MPPPSAFGAQVAAIMDVLAKAAVAEITKLAEEGCVVLRLEVRRRDHEIQELRRSLEVTEAKLSKAQEALASRATEERQTQTSCRTRTDVQEKRKAFAEYPQPNPSDSLYKPQVRVEESPAIRPAVKQEPAGELPAAKPPDGAAMAGSDGGEPGDSRWPPAAPGLFEETCAAMPQPVPAFPFRSEDYSACREAQSSFNCLSAAPETVSDGCLTAPIKVEVTMRPTCMGSPASEYFPNELLRHDSLPLVAPAECMQSVSQLVELPAALPPAQRPSFRSKGRISVWKPNQKLYTCSVCNRGFPRLSQLEEHKSTHQTLKPFRCLECGKSFTQKTRLKTHQSVHTGEKPFSCKICGKMFSRHDNCLRHERFHSGLKPHSCRQCGKSFTVLGNLKMHQEIHLQGR
ncbi:uncharacterized protein ACNS7B_019640 [Menidia menidia]